MNRLLKSSKFWVTLIGYIASLIAYKLFDDSAYALAILGTFSAIVIGNTIEDSIKQKINATVDPDRPPPDERG